MREIRTYSLSGGRWPARKRATSDPTPTKPGNAGGGKEPQFKTNAARGEGRRRLGNLTTPISVQKLQMALHAKAKAEAGYAYLNGFTDLVMVNSKLKAATSWHSIYGVELVHA